MIPLKVRPQLLALCTPLTWQTLLLELSSPYLVWGGEGPSFFSQPPTVRVGGSEVSVSPGRINSHWFEGLKGPALRGPLNKPWENGWKEYLGYVTTTPYDKKASRTGVTAAFRGRWMGGSQPGRQKDTGCP